jgi:hypothetical protein
MNKHWMNSPYSDDVYNNKKKLIEHVFAEEKTNKKLLMKYVDDRTRRELLFATGGNKGTQFAETQKRIKIYNKLLKNKTLPDLGKQHLIHLIKHKKISLANLKKLLTPEGVIALARVDEMTPEMTRQVIKHLTTSNSVDDAIASIKHTADRLSGVSRHHAALHQSLDQKIARIDLQAKKTSGAAKTYYTTISESLTKFKTSNTLTQLTPVQTKAMQALMDTLSPQ